MCRPCFRHPLALEEIGAIKDEDIDFSDTPQLGDDLWKIAKVAGRGVRYRSRGASGAPCSISAGLPGKVARRASAVCLKHVLGYGVSGLAEPPPACPLYISVEIAG